MNLFRLLSHFLFLLILLLSIFGAGFFWREYLWIPPSYQSSYFLSIFLIQLIINSITFFSVYRKHRYTAGSILTLLYTFYLIRNIALLRTYFNPPSDYPSVMQLLMNSLLFHALYFVVYIPFFAKEEQPLKRTTRLFSILLIVQIVIGYLQIGTWYIGGQSTFFTIFKYANVSYLHNGESFNTNILRISGGLLNPNFFALFLILCSPYWFVKSFLNHQVQYRFSALDLIKFFLIMYLVLFSFSRSA
ncbi:MAG: hypothetical protein QME64_10455, partial [bacterium]|nr:hypothetical protein [bacterium]